MSESFAFQLQQATRSIYGPYRYISRPSNSQSFVDFKGFQGPYPLDKVLNKLQGDTTRGSGRYSTTIQRLARLVHSTKSRDKYLAMLIAHYDWSGQYKNKDQIKHDGPVLALGGYVAPAEKWDQFEGLWHAALHKKNIPVMHITDFGKISKKWTSLERGMFLDELTEIIRNTIAHGFFTTCSVEDYVAIVEPHVPNQTYKWKHGRWKRERMPYLFLLHYCLMFMKNHIVLPEDEKISLILEDDARLRHAAMTFTDTLVRLFEWTDTFELPVNFRPKGDPHALESADILAFVARSKALHERHGYSLNPWHDSLNLKRIGPVGGGHLNRESFELYRETIYEAYALSEQIDD